VNVYGVFNDYFNIHRANRTCDWIYSSIYGNVCHCKRPERLELLMNKKIIILGLALSLIPAVSQAKVYHAPKTKTISLAKSYRYSYTYHRSTHLKCAYIGCRSQTQP